MKTNTIATKLLAAFAVAAGIGMVAPSAEACGGGWWPTVEIDYRVQGIARAEKDLAEGNYYAAAGAVIRMIPHIKSYDKASKDAIINRSMRVLAVATSRSGGDLSKLSREVPEYLHAEFLGKSSEAKGTNLAWSVKMLKAIGQTKKNDPTLESELAEAMAQIPSMKGEAKALLEKLADKDLLTTPEAYKALAKLRADAGDEVGRTAALERCRTMAKDAAMCGPKPVVVAVAGQS